MLCALNRSDTFIDYRDLVKTSLTCALLSVCTEEFSRHQVSVQVFLLELHQILLLEPVEVEGIISCNWGHLY